MSASPEKFQGWLGLSPDAINGNMQWGEFEPKTWEEDDVDIEIECCGICGSDMHCLKSGWADTTWGATSYPCVVGHEIVGKAVRVGSKVSNIKVGQRVGVGAQARSCMSPECYECSRGIENHCGIAPVTTYAGAYPDGSKSMGGYATHNRTNHHFCIPIPDSLPSADAAPMLCAGATMYAPLKRHNCGPGKTVGIIGVGGLGHFGVLFAKAMGADKVVAISRRQDKAADAISLGADQYIATAEEEGWASKYARSLDLIICTASSDKMPLTEYLGLLRTHGDFIQVGAPDGGLLPSINAFTLLFTGIKIGGSFIASPGEIEEMLQLAADKKIKPWVQKRPMKEANQAIIDMEEGKARYRYVLEQ